MTVHGSKGLEAPVVILADACADPQRMGPGGRIASLELADGQQVPVPRPRKNERVEPLTSSIAAKEKGDREEHWRLLYVALTRARERLYLGGTLPANARGGAPQDSWYRAVDEALQGLGCRAQDDARWGRLTRFGPVERPAPAATRKVAAVRALPDWIVRPAPAEERPPRPLAPSAASEDEVPYPPPGPDQRRSALRGKLLHRLFERLPGVASGQRQALADRWLAQSGEAPDADFRAALIADACRIIDDPAFAALFGAEALAEAPITAVVEGGTVVAGTADRLLVEPDRVLVADFKTGRQVPEGLEDIPSSHLRQMAAYSAALQVIFPTRRIEAALLYTAGPRLYALPPEALARFLPAAG
jgi:ATP-dependent helicase/nuclease subunit A